MYYFRFSFFLFCLLFSTHFLQAAPLTIDKEQPERQVGLLWEVSKPALEPSYLLGTIHSNDPRIVNLPPEIVKHFQEADSVTIEVPFNLNTIFQSLLAMYLPSGKTLDKLVDTQTYQQLVDILADYGVPELMVKTLKPGAVMLIIGQPKNSNTQEVILDLKLYLDAKRQGKPVYGLETVEEQLVFLDTLTIDQQVTLLIESLDYFTDIPKMLEEMHQLYMQRDLTAILEFSEEQINQSHNPDLINQLMDYLIDKRNLRMLERMQPRLQEGNAFIAVGALHLPGTKGLLTLLKEQGYTVIPVY